jgi:anti-sigma B factor antagonist
METKESVIAESTFAQRPSKPHNHLMSFTSRHHPMQLKIVATSRDQNLVIALEGALSAGDGVAAQVELLNLSATCAGRIVLDCTRLTYVASIGLRALLALHRNVSGRSQGVWLAGVNESVRHIFEMAGLLSHFKIVTTVDEALTS